MPWASDSEMNAESQENQALAYENKNSHKSSNIHTFLWLIKAGRNFLIKNHRIWLTYSYWHDVLPDFISDGLTCTHTALAAFPSSWGCSAAKRPETSCFHLALQGRRLCAGQPSRWHLTSSWTLQAATDYGLGILTQGQAYSESLVKLHPLKRLNEVTKEIEAAFTASKMKGGVF